jgi:predicted alpha/beta superfamily hydrolase
LHSEYVGQNFELSISLPRSYKNSDTNYPVIFLLDSYWAFPSVKGITDALSWPSSIIPEVILVGIGYGGSGQEAALNWVVGRTRDLTPSVNKLREESYENRLKRGGMIDIDIETGGAPQFLEFIAKELFPFIESNYRIDNNLRMLSGHSAGGLFGLFVLFHDPNLFSKYFIGSPSITTFQDSITFEFEANYALEHTDLPADVFMSVGQLEKENSESMKRISDLLDSHNYKNPANSAEIRLSGKKSFHIFFSNQR